APLSQQLTALGRQALAQGRPDQARTFFRKALQLDPANGEARRALDRQAGVRRVAMQDPAPPPAAAPAPAEAPGPAEAPAPAEAPTPPAPEPPPAEAPAGGRQAAATLEEQSRMSDVVNQQLVADVNQRLQAANDLLRAGRPQAAIDALR